MNGAAANTGEGSKGIAVGYGGTIRETIDGGQSWRDPLNLEHCAEWRIHDLHFVDASTGFQVGQFARVHTTGTGAALQADRVDASSRPVDPKGTAGEKDKDR